jgi:hypothetical protein
VLFLLAAHERHALGFRKQIAVFRSHWSPKQLVAEERPAANESLQVAHLYDSPNGAAAVE